MRTLSLVFAFVLSLTSVFSQSITLSPNKIVYCGLDAYTVTYTVSGEFGEDNVFTLQLSDASGGFDSPLILQTKTDNVSGQFVGVIPDTIPSGSAYKFRIIASNPEDTSQASPEDIKLSIIPQISITGPDAVCTTETPTFYGTKVSRCSYRWSATMGDFSTSRRRDTVVYEPTQSGAVTLTLQVMDSVTGCRKSVTKTFMVYQGVYFTMSQVGAVCKGDVSNYTLTTSTDNPVINWTVSGGNILDSDNPKVFKVQWESTPASFSVNVLNTVTGCTNSKAYTVNLVDLDTKVVGEKYVCGNKIYTYTTEAAAGIVNTWSVEGGTLITGANLSKAYVQWSPVGTGTLKLVQRVASGTCRDSVVYNIVIYPQPNVTLNKFPNVCANAPMLLLSGGQPQGGDFSGSGVSNNYFDASTVGVGKHLIRYTYKNKNGCSAFAEQTIEVVKSPNKPYITQEGNTLRSSVKEGNQWYYYNEPVAGGNADSLQPTQNGLYYVQVSDASTGCKSEKSEPISFQYVNVKDVSDANVRIYPNPTNGIVLIDLSNTRANSVSIIVTDLSGNMLVNMDKELTGQFHYNLNLSELANGVYFLQLNFGNQIVKEKIILNK